MNWSVPRMWEDGDVWIIGGGPSIASQFEIPKQIVKDVIEGTLPPNAYSPYMSGLHNKHVIGINVAYMIGDWIDVIFFGDGGFYLQHQQGLAKFPGLKISCSPKVSNCEWVKYLSRDAKHSRGISENSSTISWNHNSGSAAISVAAHAGAKRIILLGFDMKLSTDAHQHWHDVYKRGKIVEEKRVMRLPFDRHRRCFVDIAKDAHKLGIEIINASPESTIQEFPKMTVKELLFNN